MKNIFGTIILLSTASFASEELINAVRDNDVDAVQAILPNEKNIDDVDSSPNGLNRTALMHAVYDGKLKIAELVLEKKPNLELRDQFGNTALIYASLNGHQQMVALLLEHGAILDQTNSKNLTALIQASSRYDAEKDQVKKACYMNVLSMLLQNGAKYEAALIPKLTKQMGESAFKAAVTYNTLLRTGIDEGTYKKLPTALIDLIISLMGKEPKDEPVKEAPSSARDALTNMFKKAAKIIIHKK